MIFQDKDRIVFAGDSITDMEKTDPLGEGGGIGDNLGKGYVHFVHDLLAATYPEKHLRITNSGISGNTSKQLLERWGNDVLELKPDWVSICIGVNDCLNHFIYPERGEILVSLEEYESNLEVMVKSVKDTVKGIIIISPYIAEPNQNDPARREMDRFREKAREVSEKHHCKYIDIQEMFDRYFEKRHQSMIAWDRVHPNTIGSYLIAKEFLLKCEFDFYN